MYYINKLVGLALITCTLFLGACNQMTLLNPKGPIAEEEIFLIYIAFALMLFVVVPVFIMVIWFSIKYRASNKKASYKPKWAGSTKIEWAIWLVPVAIVVALSYFTWTRTFQLDPYLPIKHSEKAINIEVVSMDWGWLFIYPDYKLAIVNKLVFPANTPLNFKLTSSSVMTSFFIPQLGSQMYAMAGMQTQLNLMADTTGTFEGQNQEFSGPGYEDMHFRVISTTSKKFKKWVNEIKTSPDTLSFERYEQLIKPKLKYTITNFSSVETGLFDHILSRYKGWMGDIEK